MSTFALKDIDIAVDGKTVVSDISLTLNSGEIHVLMGPNGSGKSSLLMGIMGHPKFPLTKGTVMLDGEDITMLSTEKKARAGLFLSMQYLPEIAGVTLLNFLHKANAARKTDEEGEGKENIETSILDYYKKLESRAKEVGIDPAFLRRQVGAGLSGGEKKQAEMLQMLALRPAFAFLDEIDSGVDVDALKRVVAAINKSKEEGTGFLLVTHYASLLDHITPDHVHVMRDGRIFRSGGRELAEEVHREGFGK